MDKKTALKDLHDQIRGLFDDRKINQHFTGARNVPDSAVIILAKVRKTNGYESLLKGFMSNLTLALDTYSGKKELYWDETPEAEEGHDDVMEENFIELKAKFYLV